MTFDLLSRFRKPVPTRDPRGHHHVQRPPPMVTRVHTKRPAPVPQARPQVRRGHHRDQHQPSLALVPHPFTPAHKGPVARPPPPARRGPVVRAPAPSRKGPAMRVPARPHPPQRGSSKLLNCLHIHLHPSHKRDLALPPPRPSKRAGGQQAPPFPPPRGVIKVPPRHVHWAPAQAPLPSQPYPYPSHISSRTTSHTTSSYAHAQHHPSPPVIPRYQPPSQPPPPSRDLVLVPHRRK